MIALCFCPVSAGVFSDNVAITDGAHLVIYLALLDMTR